MGWGGGSAILASLAFGMDIRFGDVHVEGITQIQPSDIKAARELGYVIKLLGIARREDAGISTRVHPCMVPVGAPIARVDGVFNAVVAEGDFVGRIMMEGRGAGGGRRGGIDGALIGYAQAPVDGARRGRMIGRTRTTRYQRARRRDRPFHSAEDACDSRTSPWPRCVLHCSAPPWNAPLCPAAISKTRAGSTLVRFASGIPRK